MTDTISPERRSENMRRIRGKGMKPEILVRQLVHGLGFRFRLHRTDLPGKPDLVLPRHRKIILVHGCFWHGHSDPSCVDGRRQPKSNLDYWLPKLARNKERDQLNIETLNALGWRTLIVWECETKHPGQLRDKLKSFVEERSNLRYAA
jgi:DNA mismatch endonuclease, patch repair protein